MLQLTFLLILMSCQAPSRTPSNVFYHDDRLRLAKDAKLPIGTIYNSLTDERTWGTGFQIDACHVLTNYHVVYDTAKEVPADHQVYFEDQAKGERIAAKLVLSGRPFELTDHSVLSTNPHDWALLELKTCLEKERYFTLANYEYNQLEQMDLKMMGFPQNSGNSQIALDPHCRIRNEATYGLLHDCASRPGSSGSPIYLDQDGILEVVALNVSQRSDFDELISSYSDWIANVALAPESYFVPIQDYLNAKELTAPLP